MANCCLRMRLIGEFRRGPRFGHSARRASPTRIAGRGCRRPVPFGFWCCRETFGLHRRAEAAGRSVGQRMSLDRRTLGIAWVFATAFSIVIAGGTTQAWAQRPVRPPAAPPPGPAAGAPGGAAPMVVVPVEINAPVSVVQQGMIIVHDGQQPVSLRVGERTEVHIRGKVEPDMLKPGAAVRFFAEIDKRNGRSRGKVDQIILFTPSKDGNRMLGAFYHQPSAVGSPDGPAAPAGDAAGAPDDEKSPEAGRTGRAVKAEEQFELFDVRGQVVGLRGAVLTVNVQTNYFRSPIRVEMSEGCTIIADLADVGVVRPGDQVQGRGIQMMPQALEMLSLEVTLAESLTSLPRKKSRPQTAKTPSRNPPSQPAHPRESFEVADQIAKERAEGNKTAPPGGNMAPPADGLSAVPHGEGPGPNGPPGQAAPAGERPPMAQAEPRRNADQPPGPAQPPSPSAAPGGELPKRSAEETLKLAEKLVELLGTSRQEQILRGGFKARLADGKEAVFLPAQRVTADDLRQRVGQPDRTDSFAAELPVGEDGALQKVQWSMWTYGPIRVLVDDRGKTQYLGVQSPDGQAKPAPD